MIDLHCHILPAIDDGASTWDDSLAMARIAAADGIRIIAATPHLVDPGLTADRIRQLVGQFNQLLAEQQVPVAVVAGAEFPCHLDPSLAPAYCLQNTSCLMVEFPHNHLPAMAYPFLRRLTAMGIRPCIVHPERNPDIQHHPEVVRQLRLEYDVLIQLTAGSLCGEWGGSARLCAIYLLRHGLCDFIASDAHSPGQRPPQLSRAVKLAAKFSSQHRAWAMVHDHPQALLHPAGAV